MSTAKWSTLEESSSLATVFLFFTGIWARPCVASLFCTGAWVSCTVTGSKEGRLTRGSNWANRANLEYRGMMQQFMQALSVRASCKWPRSRHVPQWSWPSSAFREAKQLVQLVTWKQGTQEEPYRYGTAGNNRQLITPTAEERGCTQPAIHAFNTKNPHVYLDAKSRDEWRGPDHLPTPKDIASRGQTLLILYSTWSSADGGNQCLCTASDS